MYCSTNSHYLTYTFLLKMLGECTFELGSKGSMGIESLSTYFYVSSVLASIFLAVLFEFNMGRYMETQCVGIYLDIN